MAVTQAQIDAATAMLAAVRADFNTAAVDFDVTAAYVNAHSDALIERAVGIAAVHRQSVRGRFLSAPCL